MENSMGNVVLVTKKLMYILNSEQKRYGIYVIVASFIGALLETLGVSFIIPLINALLTPEKLMNNRWLQKPLAYLNIHDSASVVVLISIATILLYLFKNLYFIFLSWVRAKYSCKIQRELSVHMMQTYMKKGYPFFLTTNTGELMRGVLDDVNGVYTLLSQLCRVMVEVMTVVLICIFILIQDPVMAVCIAVLAVFCFLIIYGIFRKKMKKSGEQFRKSGTLVNQNAIQAFQGIKEVVVMHRQKYFADRFEEARSIQQQASVQYAVASENPAYVIEAICIAGLLGTVCVRIAFGKGNVNEMLPILSALAVAAFRILPAVGKISNSMNIVMFNQASLNSMYNHIDGVQKNKDNIQKTYENDCQNETSVLEFSKELKIEKVCWRYSADQNNVLDELDMTIKKGTSVALVGHSGAGKTTLADIILGLLKPQSGKVYIDNEDIFSLGENWSKIIGYVPQSVYLVDDSIRKNIAFGVEDKDIDDKKVWNALEQAQLKDFVQGLDKKLDTLVGERGVRFSGGQRQRMAIARALYESPDILVLDEATAALDHETEKAVMESIETLQGFKTLIIIAHRITTIKGCDEIYEIVDGKAVRREYGELGE